MKRKMFLLSALALMVAGGVFWSCQKEEVLLNNADGLMLKSVIANYPASCEDVCIDLSLGEDVVYYEKSGSFAGSIGGNSKSIGYTVYNTEDHFVVELSYTRTPANSGSSSTIEVTVDGEKQSTTIKNGNSDVLEFPLAADWSACDEVVWALEETVYDGGQITGGGTYELIGVCSDCEESFNYVNNVDGTYTFTYVPAEDMTDVEVVFTFPQVETVTFLEGYEFESFKRPGQGQVMKATLSFEACQEYSWNIQLVDCTAASATANGWTDFKVGDVSRKNSLPNITYKCPGN